VRDFVKPFPGARIIDLGCGTAEVLRFLPGDVEYTGFDMSESYIEAARSRYGGRGRFICAKVEDFNLASVDSPGEAVAGQFDIAIAFGVLHHLGDSEARRLFRSAREALKPGGRLVTLDSAFTSGQSYLSRYLVSKDRGQNVRYPDAFAGLGEDSFASIEVTPLRNALRIPFDHAILVCRT
jgi:SAM-dependent methyltransferase